MQRELQALTGDDARVRQLLRRSVPIYRTMPDWPHLREIYLDLIAQMATRDGQLLQAARFIGAWELLVKQAGRSRGPGRLVREHEAAATLEAALGTAAFAAARAEGERMDIDRAIDEVLADEPRT